MDITSIIGVLLFVLPGIFAQKISHIFDFPSGKKRTEIGELVNGIALSFPILFVVILVMRIFYRFSTLTEYTNKMSNATFLIVFILITVVFVLLFGLLAVPVKNIIMKNINEHRKKKGKMRIDDKSCWRKFTVDKNERRYMKVIKDGKEYSGFAYAYSLPDEETEIILENPANIEDYPEAMPLLNRVNLTYINIEKGIIIEDYDTTKFFDKIDELSKK